MSAYDWAVVAAVAALLILASSYPRRRNDHDAWQQSTGSTPQTVADDDVEYRRERERAELEAWLQLPLQPRNTIPHQTRRTEEDR